MNKGGIAASLIKWSLLVALAMPFGAEAAPFRLLVLGDSIGAGRGLPPGQSFPARLAADLAAAGHPVTILDASVSGDTTAGGLARIGDALAQHPDAALLELGANDALRGIDPNLAYDNLDKILAKLQEGGVKVMLLGMRAPANWGRDYQQQFDAIYPRLAQKYNVPLYPFFLDGVALDPALNQSDGLHPNPRGVDVIVERLEPEIARLLQSKGAQK